nr:EAL domain-containing protein [Simiduia aestuariiviva]
MLWLSAEWADQQKIAASKRVVERNFLQLHDSLIIKAKDLAWWDLILSNVVEQRNEQWLTVNFRDYLLESYDIEGLLILSDKGDPLYGEFMGQAVSSDDNLGFAPNGIRQLFNQAQLAPMDIPVPVGGLLVREGRPYMVAICAITTDIEEHILPSGTARPALLLIRSLHSVLPELTKANDVFDIQFISSNEIPGHPNSKQLFLDIADHNDNKLGAFVWSTALPGQQLVLNALMWAIPLAVFFIAIGWYITRGFRVAINNAEQIAIDSAVKRDSDRNFQLVAESAPVLIWVSDHTGVCGYANRAFEDIFGIRPTLQNPIHLNHLFDETCRNEFQAYLEESLAGVELDRREFKINDKHGSKRWLSIACTQQKDSNGRRKVIFSATDSTEKKLLQDNMWLQANYDELTGLANRTLLQDRLKRLLQLSKRSSTELAILFVDLDNFKTINDTLGHNAGDQALVQAARRIEGCLRDSDTVARLGGDEFVLLLPMEEGGVIVDKIIRRLLHRLSEYYLIDDKPIYLSASIGIAIFPHNGSTAEELMMNADAAMYQAKKSGKNKSCFFSPEMNLQLRQALELEADIRAALTKAEFFLVYQPIIDLASGNIASVEALVRWRRSDGHIMAPDLFIATAEQTGLIVQLGEYIFKESCAQLRRLRDSGHEITMSINISPVQFQAEGIVERFTEFLHEFSVQAHWIQLEITEALLLDDYSENIELIQTLSDMGFKIAIDDFGTGYSSLSYLRKFPVDVVKIDKTFIEGIPVNIENVALVKAIIAMAKSLQLSVIAEGVEAEAHHDFLCDLQCNRAQGYLYSRPVDACDLNLSQYPVRAAIKQQIS